MVTVKPMLAGLLCAAALAVPAAARTATLTEDAKLTPSDGAAANLFGRSVAVDGDTAVVGATFGDGNEVDSGSAGRPRRKQGRGSNRSMTGNPLPL